LTSLELAVEYHLRVPILSLCTYPSPVFHVFFFSTASAQVQKSLKEDTTKKYTDDGMDLVETLKKRCVAWKREDGGA